MTQTIIPIGTNTETASSANAATSNLFLGQTGEAWDFWLIIAVIFAALSAGAIGVTTTGSIIAHKREARAAKFERDKVQAETDRKVAEATSSGIEAGEKAGNAQAAADDAHVKLKQAEAQIAEANARAAEARLALEKLKTPRTLNSGRQRFVTAATAPFKGQQYLVAISQGADDGVTFWESLYPALQEAGWVYVPSGPPSVGIPPAGIPIASIPGVEIRFSAAEEKKLAPAALALGNALHADGMVVAVNKDPSLDQPGAPHDALLIVLGARVAPP